MLHAVCPVNYLMEQTVNLQCPSLDSGSALQVHTYSTANVSADKFIVIFHVFSVVWHVSSRKTNLDIKRGIVTQGEIE